MGRKRFADRRLCQKAAPRFHTHIALCVMYTGSSFRGLQLQTHCPTHHTVEGVLIQALTDIGLIKAIQRGKPHDNVHHLARACRTDRGVHAIRNVVTLFVPTNKLEWLGGECGLQKELNSRLPYSIRVGCVLRVTGNFVPRHCCNRRVYRYLIPVYALFVKCDSWETFCQEFTHAATEIHTLTQTSNAINGCSDLESCEEEEEREHMQHMEENCKQLPYINLTHKADSSCTSMQWLREVQTAVNFCNDILQEYIVGSHRFHNFSNSESNKVESMSSSSSFSSADKLYDPNSDEAARMIYRCEIAPRVYFLNAHKHGASFKEYTYNTDIVRKAQEEKEIESTSSKDSITDNDNSNQMKNQCAELSKEQIELTSISAFPHTSSGDDKTDKHKEGEELSQLPFVILQIEGGSFLFNMIRKIVGTLLAVCRGARRELFSDALCPTKRVSTPLAPGAYLLLAYSSYRGYDNYVYACRQSRLKQQQSKEEEKGKLELEEHKQPERELEKEECELICDKNKEQQSCLSEKKEEQTSTIETVTEITMNTKTEARKEMNLINKTQLQTFQEAWSSEVSVSFEHFALECIYNDIVDLDLNRLPSLEAMLFARDSAHDLLRPQWRTVEDVHLQTMKEYSAITPEVVQRAAQSKCSAMTLFLRLLRVHNWSIRSMPIPEDSKAMLEIQNKKRRKLEACEELQTNKSHSEDDDDDAQNGCKVGNNVNSTSNENKDGEKLGVITNIEENMNEQSDATVYKNAINDEGIDDSSVINNGNDDDNNDDVGWIYVAANEHEERLLRQAYHAKSCNNKSRTWERSKELLNERCTKSKK